MVGGGRVTRKNRMKEMARVKTLVREREEEIRKERGGGEEKKNTMLLTVIAVATLLVAVVGATFAYFSLTVSGSATDTKVNVSSDKVATLTYETGTATATLKVSAADMAKPDKDTKYYATIDSQNTDSETGGIWLKEEGSTHDEDKAIHLGGVSLTEGGDETYSCEYTITLSKDEGINTMVDALNGHENEVMLQLTGKGLDLQTYDLSKLNSENSNTKVFKAKFQLTGKELASSLTDSETFDATLYLLNSQSNPQDYLAGTSLNLKFSYSASCSVDSTLAD